MRVGFLNATCEIGGAEVSIVITIKALDKSRFQPFVALPGPGPLADRVRALGIEPDYIPMETRRRRRPFAFRKSQNAIYRWVKDKALDVIHINSFWAPELAVAPAKKAGCKVIYHCRDFYDRLDSDRADAFSMCDVIVNCSRCVADNVVRLIPGIHAEVVYCSVDSAEVEESEPDISILRGLGWEDCFVTGIASRISPDKGQLEFVRAAGLLASRYPQVRFLVLGGSQFTHRDSYESEVRKEAERLGIRDKIHFTGFRENVPSALKIMNAFVLASHSEPLGRVVFEAMACGVPVVATRSGGPQEIITDGVDGMLVDVGNPGQIAEALTRLIEDSDLRESIRINAMETVKTRFEFSNARKIERVYESLISDEGMIT